MAEEPVTHTATEVPKKEGGFPPFDTTTFPSQLFWLVVTFAFLFTVLWRVAGPRINGAITNRRAVINAAIAEAPGSEGFSPLVMYFCKCMKTMATPDTPSAT